MRYTKFIGSDADECIQGFKKLSESLRNSLEILRKIMSENSVNEEGYEILSETEKTLVRQIAAAEETAEKISKAAEMYALAEERIKTLMKKNLFLTDKKIIVEKPVNSYRSEFTGGHILQHGDELSRMVLKNMTGENR